MQNLKTVDFGVAFTLTRPAPADYEDKDGNTQTAAANEPRFNYSNGVAQGLLLDASRSETAAIDDVPLFNSSAGHWIIDAEFYNSEPLKGMGLNGVFTGSGKMVVSYSGGTAKVWSGGQAIYTVASYTPAEPTHICEGGMATIGELTYKPSAISDADAAALATGDFEVLFTPLQLFAGGRGGAWYDPSDLTTLFQDAAGTIPVTADGDPVGLMLDKSGNDNHAVQSTTSAKPVYRTGGGANWLKFDGRDDVMVLPGLQSLVPDFSLFLSVQIPSPGLDRAAVTIALGDQDNLIYPNDTVGAAVRLRYGTDNLNEDAGADYSGISQILTSRCAPGDQEVFRGENSIITGTDPAVVSAVGDIALGGALTAAQFSSQLFYGMVIVEGDARTSLTDMVEYLEGVTP